MPYTSLQFCFMLTNAYCGLYRASYSGGCGSFYAITIASEKLKGLPILKQHRRIKEVLKDDMAGLHGLQVCHFDSPMSKYLTSFRASTFS